MRHVYAVKKVCSRQTLMISHKAMKRYVGAHGRQLYLPGPHPELTRSPTQASKTWVNL